MIILSMMAKRTENKFLKWLGIGFMILSGFVVLAAFPGTPLSTISIGPLKVTGIDTVSATKIAVGAVLFFLGLTAYKKR